jgi:hypothetical protein
MGTVGPTILAEKTKQVEHGTTGLAAALSLPFPANIPAFAIVAAMLASIGVAVAGGGGKGKGVDISKERQRVQGTGVSMGTDVYDWELNKSKSLGDSLEVMRDNSDIALRYSSSQLSVLERINTGISGMASLVTRGSSLRGTKADERMFGVGSSKTFSGFSKASTELLDTGIIFDRITTYEDELLNQLNKAKTESDRASIYEQIKGQYGGDSEMQGQNWAQMMSMSIIPDAALKTSSQSIGSIMGGGLSAHSYADLHSEKSSFWGLSKSSNDRTELGDLDTELKNQLTLTIGDMFTSISKSATFLGRDGGMVDAAMKNMKLEDAGLDRISLKGMKADEIEKELESVFGALGDKMAEAAMPGLKGFQKAGEGYMTTLIKVASGVDTATYALEKLGVAAVDYKDISNKSGDVGVEMVRDSLVKSETHLTGFKEVSRTIEVFGIEVSTFIDQVAQYKTTGIGEILKDMSGSVSELADAYKDLDKVRRQMGAIGLKGADVTTETVRGAGGLDNLTSGMDDYLDNFFTEAQKASVQTKLLSQDFSKLGIAMPASKDQFVAMVNGIDRTTVAGQALFGALMSLSGRFGDLADEAGNVNPALAAQRGVVNDLVKSATKWMDTLRNAKDLLSEIDSEMNGSSNTEERISELWQLMNADTIDLDQQIDLAGELKDLVLEKYRLEKENAEDLVQFGKDMQAYVKDLKTGDKSPLTNDQKLQEALTQYNETFGKANAGDKDARDAVQGKADTLLELGRTYFASSSNYTDLFDMVTDQLDQLGVDAISAGQSMEMLASGQLDELKELRSAVTTMKDEAQTEYSRAQTNLARELQLLQDMYDALDLISDVPQILKDMPAELAAAMSGRVNMGAVSSSSSETNLVSQVEAMYQTLLGRHSEQAGLEYWVQQLKGGMNMTDLRWNFLNSPEYKQINGSHANGLDYVPFDGYVAELHRGERVQTAEEARRTDKSRMVDGRSAFSTDQMAELKAEIRDLKSEVSKLRTENREDAGQIINAQYGASQAAAEAMVEGVEACAKSSAFDEKSKPSYA